MAMNQFLCYCLKCYAFVPFFGDPKYGKRGSGNVCLLIKNAEIAFFVIMDESFLCHFFLISKLRNNTEE